MTLIPASLLLVGTTQITNATLLVATTVIAADVSAVWRCKQIMQATALKDTLTDGITNTDSTGGSVINGTGCVPNTERFSLDDVLNSITCGNCLKFTPQLPDTSLDGVLIDPPYGENQGFEGDETPAQAGDLLQAFLEAVQPKVKRNGHVAIFWTMRGLDACIDALRATGFTYRRVLSMYLPKGSARPYLGWLPRTQAIVIGQKYLPKQPTDFHADMAQYLSNAVKASGLSRGEIAKRLGCNSRLVMKWTRVGDPAWCLPTPRFYQPLKKLLNLDDEFDVLLDREPVNDANRRTDYEYRHDTYIVSDKTEKMLQRFGESHTIY